MTIRTTDSAAPLATREVITPTIQDRGDRFHEMLRMPPLEFRPDQPPSEPPRLADADNTPAPPTKPSENLTQSTTSTPPKPCGNCEEPSPIDQEPTDEAPISEATPPEPSQSPPSDDPAAEREPPAEPVLSTLDERPSAETLALAAALAIAPPQPLADAPIQADPASSVESPAEPPSTAEQLPQSVAKAGESSGDQLVALDSASFDRIQEALQALSTTEVGESPVATTASEQAQALPAADSPTLLSVEETALLGAPETIPVADTLAASQPTAVRQGAAPAHGDQPSPSHIVQAGAQALSPVGSVRTTSDPAQPDITDDPRERSPSADRGSRKRERGAQRDAAESALSSVILQRNDASDVIAHHEPGSSPAKPAAALAATDLGVGREPLAALPSAANAPPVIAPGAPAPATRAYPKAAAQLLTGLRRTSETRQQDVDQVRLMQRVARALESARDRGGEVRIRLNPPELGLLKVELQIHDGRLHARLEAETPAAQVVLLENVGALRERLAEQGLRLERFDVDLSHRDSSGAGGQSGQPRDEAPRELFRPRPALPTQNRTAAPAAETPVASRSLDERQVNVVV